MSASSWSGSGGEHVIRSAVEPVWIVHPFERSLALIDRVICPVDDSDCSRAALQSAIFIAQRLETALTVLHVLGRQESSGDRSRADLAAFVGQLDTTGLAGEQKVLRGNAGDVIQAEVGSAATELMVMGTRGRSGVSRLVVGSVTESVLPTLD